VFTLYQVFTRESEGKQRLPPKQAGIMSQVSVKPQASVLGGEITKNRFFLVFSWKVKIRRELLR